MLGAVPTGAEPAVRIPPILPALRIPPMFPFVRKPPMLPASVVEETMIINVIARRVGLSVFILDLLVNGLFTGWAGWRELRWSVIVVDQPILINAVHETVYQSVCHHARVDL